MIVNKERMRESESESMSKHHDSEYTYCINMPQTPLCQRQICISELVIDLIIIIKKRNFNNREKSIFAISSG